MKVKFRHIILLILSSILISCSGNEKPSPTVLKNTVPNKITVPKHGFSNGLIDNKGHLWFTSNGGGIFFYNGKTFANYTTKNGLNSNQVFSIAQDHNDNIWFGTQKGLTKYNGQHFEHTPLPFQDTSSVWLDKVYPVINPNSAHALTVDKHDNLWIGTAGGGAYRYSEGQFTSYLTQIGRKQDDSLYHNWIPFIREDMQGNLWFASMTHGGIHQFDGEQFTPFSTKDGLSDNQVRTIYSDKSGNLWIGFNGNRKSGLTVYNGKSFNTYS